MSVVAFAGTHHCVPVEASSVKRMPLYGFMSGRSCGRTSIHTTDKARSLSSLEGKGYTERTHHCTSMFPLVPSHGNRSPIYLAGISYPAEKSNDRNGSSNTWPPRLLSIDIWLT